MKVQTLAEETDTVQSDLPTETNEDNMMGNIATKALIDMEGISDEAIDNEPEEKFLAESDDSDLLSDSVEVTGVVNAEYDRTEMSETIAVDDIIVPRKRHIPVEKVPRQETIQSGELAGSKLTDENNNDIANDIEQSAEGELSKKHFWSFSFRRK